MAYLRQLKKRSFFGNEQTEASKRIFMTKCVDLEFELSCMNLYHGLVEWFCSKYE